MKNNKKLIKNIINFSICFSILINTNFKTFAEANIIYQPTAAPKEIEQTYDETENYVTAEPSAQTYYEHSNSIDYDNIHIMVSLDDDYYCYENNTIAKKAWRKINKSSFRYYGIPCDNFQNDYIWMYFQSNGKAVKSNNNKFKKMKIDGYNFAFNEYGQMIEGFFNEEGEMWTDYKNHELLDLIESSDNFYYADPENGILYAGWLMVENITNEYEKKDKLYFYFSPSSYKAVRATGNGYKTVTIDGKKYAFDDNGVLLTGFEAYEYNVENGISDTSVKYFGIDGALTQGFITAVPSEQLDNEKYEDDEKITYYVNQSGNLYKNIIKKIGNYYYGFTNSGEMITNLSVWRNGSYLATIDPEDTDGREFAVNNKYMTNDGTQMTLNPSTDIVHYFNKTGKRVVSTIDISFGDDTYTYNASNNGAFNGYKEKKFYQNGILMKPTEEKYGVYIENKTKSNYNMQEICNNTSAYLINKSGSKVTGRTGQKDDNDNYWLVNSSGNILNVYSVDVKYSNGKYFFKSETSSGGSEKWIEFGTPDYKGKTCVLDRVNNGMHLSNGATTSYQVTPNKYYGLNFNLS